MQKTITTIIAIPFVLLILFSCSFGGGNAGIPDDKKDYIGAWASDEVYLEISEEGNVNYKRQSGGGSTSVKAPIQKFEGDSFIVGALGFDTKFVVSEAPHEENGVWSMTVDGRELTKVEFKNF
ncbi:MAG: hypothetical protein V4604_05345 [Bacteroidota bacterium]